MSRYPTTRIGKWAERNPHKPPLNPKPMDIPIISREAIRKNVARIALDTGRGIDAAIIEYAEQINFTPEALRAVIEFAEEEQPS